MSEYEQRAADDQMSGRRGRVPPGVRLLGRLFISAGVLGWLVWRIEWRPILEAFARVKLEFCCLSLLTYCFAQLVSSIRWKLLARSLGFDEKLARYVSLYYVGMFFNLFLPTSMGGDVVRAWYLGVRKGARGLALLSVISERFSGLLALLLVASIAAAWEPAGLPEWSLWLVWGLAVCGFVGILTLPFLGRYHAKLQSLAEGLSLYSGRRRSWLAGFGLSLIVQLAGIVEVWLLGLALGVPASLLVFAVAAPLVTLLTMLPITLNGVGVREGALVLLLAPAGVGSAEALALGVLWFCILVTASLLGGIVFLAGEFGQQSSVSTPLSIPIQKPGMGTGTGTGTEGEDGFIGHHSDQGRAGQSSAAA